MKMSDAPSALTLTYQGWLFGHGFVRGGTAIFRNSLYVADRVDGMPYGAWGMIALHCPTVDDVMAFTREHGVCRPFHTTVADERGGIVGIENGRGGPVFVKPKRGIYTHANCVIGGKRMLRYEHENGVFCRADSLNRTQRLQERLGSDGGRLTPQLAYAAMCDHAGYPVCVCRHQGRNVLTGGIAIAEPTRGLLHVTRGNPCQNWPRTFSL
jgi:hypothetical protein